MQRKSLYILVLLVTLFNISCGDSAEKESPATDKKESNSIAVLVDQHNSSNSLDWNGTYRGIIPCADCEGIETEIILSKDNTYSLKTKYLGKANNVLEEKGSFNWNSAGNTIILSGLSNKPNQYFVGENKLIQLDMSGNKITGGLADKYILLKQ